VAAVDNIQLIIDTDIVIDFLRRRSEILQKVIDRFTCGITAVTFYELLAVAVRSPQQEQLLSEFISIVTVLPFDQEAAEAAANIWRTLQRQGMSIGLPDTLIAGICLAQSLPLLTRNQRHYQRVSDLQLLHPSDLQ
jgi:predicted nucleic acid-binding protein